MGSFTAELRRFIERLKLMEDDSRTMKRDLIVLRQGMRDLWTETSGIKVSVTTLNGRIVGGLTVSNTPMPDTSLRIEGATTGTDYGTYSVPTGIYSLDLVIDPSDTSVNLYPAGPVSPRFAGATPLAYAQSISVGSVNTMAAVTPPAAAGYGYILETVGGSFACLYPVGSLAWTDSLIGSGTAAAAGFGTGGIGAGGIWLSACQLGNSFLAGACPARIGVPLSFVMNQQAQAGIRYNTVSGVNPCPALAACPGNGFGQSFAFGAAIVSKTDPSFDLATKFDCTWNISDQMWHNGIANTLRFREP